MRRKNPGYFSEKNQPSFSAPELMGHKDEKNRIEDRFASRQAPPRNCLQAIRTGHLPRSGNRRLGHLFGIEYIQDSIFTFGKLASNQAAHLIQTCVDTQPI